MLDAAKAMAMTAIDILCDANLQKNMKTDFLEATAQT